MKSKSAIFLTCLLALILFGHLETANAYPVTWEYKVTIDSVDQGQEIASYVSVGDELTTYITFDSDETDSWPGPDQGEYRISHFTVSVGSLYGESEGTITVYNSLSSDILGISNRVSPLPWGVPPDPFDILLSHLSLHDLDSSVFADESLPVMPPELAEFENTYFYLRAYYGDLPTGTAEGMARGTITSLRAVSPVPEPATMLLFGSGLMGLAGLRRGFRKK